MRYFRLVSSSVVLGLAFVLVLGCGESPPESASEPASASSSGYTITHVKVGAGSSPEATDTVLVHYHGTFPDGRGFDSTVDRGAPARFPLNRVIPCWTQGVAEMRVGGKALLICSPDVAYGERGKPPKIPPNATLHFDLELIGIQ